MPQKFKRWLGIRADIYFSLSAGEEQLRAFYIVFINKTKKMNLKVCWWGLVGLLLRLVGSSLLKVKWSSAADVSDLKIEVYLEDWSSFDTIVCLLYFKIIVFICCSSFIRKTEEAEEAWVAVESRSEMFWQSC